MARSSLRTTRTLAVCFALAAVFALSVASQTTVAVTSDGQTSPRPVLLLAGDSLTEHGTIPDHQGFVTLLQSRYTQSADFIVRGLSGYNTRWFLKYVMPTLEREISIGTYTSPSLITVWLGTNDATLIGGSNSEMHVPIEDYKKNLNQIVRRFQSAAPKAKILLITPPHVDDKARAKAAAERTDSKRGLVDRSDAASGNYSVACVEVAKALKVPVLDLYSHFSAMPLATRNAMLVDGLHFNAKGHRELDELLRSKLSAEFPALFSSLDVYQFPFVSKWMEEDPYTEGNSSSRS
ncbi:hypothetical protein PHYSODRAFT_488092 [Phytophthora sojae]|uniref:SGNH hydrolase-type esterase domain-containing protein n=1 Tax=Phytophthora sojae (strain P6497) TaxID=1094619 RepID=G4Z449_PHYSP|nr:hypothetical protein PHYSODRAFT_488092 [Phytophthora sojae]EGZ22243.1 hypothetical protein PHYSODRAFT_488092 [Phytophthora sojae]|eukprot:XP_009524960.1 hypothetical protein PHYSODRAFT_488092 [Phytophthora sojae]